MLKPPIKKLAILTVELAAPWCSLENKDQILCNTGAQLSASLWGRSENDELRFILITIETESRTWDYDCPDIIIRSQSPVPEHQYSRACQSN